MFYDESEVVFRNLPHRQLWVSDLSKVSMQWIEVDANLCPTSLHDIALHQRVHIDSMFMYVCPRSLQQLLRVFCTDIARRERLGRTDFVVGHKKSRRELQGTGLSIHPRGDHSISHSFLPNDAR